MLASLPAKLKISASGENPCNEVGGDTMPGMPVEGKGKSLSALVSRRKLFAGYFFLLWTALLLSLAVFLIRGWRALHNPFQLDYGEGMVIWQAQHVTDLKLAYRNVSQFPHLVFHYPPLYHLASRLFDLATGDLLVAGRLVSILSTLGVSFLSGLIVWSALPRRMPVSIRATGAALGAMLCCGIPPLVWAFYMRVDMLAFFFEFAGIYLYLQGRRRQSLEYAAFFCFFLALYTKQTTIAGPLACTVVALLIAPKKALRQFGLLSACWAGTMAALVLATHGQILRHLFLYNMNPLSFRRLFFLLQPNGARMGSIAAAALALPVAFLVELLTRPSRRLARLRAAMLCSPFHRFTVVGGLFLIIAFSISFTAAKLGATINYMLEWNLAACPLAALLFSDVLYWWHRQQRLLPAHAAILLLPVIYTQGELHVTSFTYEDWEIVDSQRNSAAVLERIRQVDGPVYSVDMVLLYRAGKPLAAEPASVSVLAEQRRWDDTPFANRIESGYFDLIVSRSQLSERLWFSPRVEAAIERAYELNETIGDYRLYRPRKPVRTSVGRHSAKVLISEVGGLDISRFASDGHLAPLSRIRRGTRRSVVVFSDRSLPWSSGRNRSAAWSTTGGRSSGLASFLDLDHFDETTITVDDNRYVIRREIKSALGKVLQAAGVAIPTALGTA